MQLQTIPTSTQTACFGKIFLFFPIQFITYLTFFSGYCSREQIYRPENCGICHAILIGKAGSGFWEGGKGTRNRVLMSRKGMYLLTFPSLSMCILTISRSAEVQASWRDDTWGCEFVEEKVDRFKRLNCIHGGRSLKCVWCICL